MSSDSRGADQLKNQGNDCFKRGKYNAAIELYTQAIMQCASAALYSNRAMCHLKRSLQEGCEEWSQVEEDCLLSLELEPHGRSSYKALYNLGVAQTKLGRHAAARQAFAKARALCDSLSTGAQGDSVSLAKLEVAMGALRKEEWEAEETARTERRTHTLDFLMGLVDTAQAEADSTATDGERPLQLDMLGTHRQELQRIMAEEGDRARKREIPDWLCCKITWDVVRDPVLTPDGVTYERSVITEHLEKNGDFDPVTRNRLQLSDLRANLALKAATDEFLLRNPWAAVPVS
jgi:STIP1 family protein 1